MCIKSAHNVLFLNKLTRAGTNFKKKCILYMFQNKNIRKINLSTEDLEIIKIHQFLNPESAPFWRYLKPNTD